jgi:hypothetical protein
MPRTPREKDTMILITMQGSASVKDMSGVIKFLENHGLTPHISRNSSSTLIGVVDPAGNLLIDDMRGLSGVDHVEIVKKAFKLSSRDFKHEKTVVTVGGSRIGSGEITVMAGPCAVESREQLLETAHRVREGGATILRGGAFKPRSSPSSSCARRGRPPDSPSSPRSSRSNTSGSCPRRPTSSRSERGTCRTSRCSTPWGESGNRSCSSGE